jgi:hypothetical protein
MSQASSSHFEAQSVADCGGTSSSYSYLWLVLQVAIARTTCLDIVWCGSLTGWLVLDVDKPVACLPVFA